MRRLALSVSIVFLACSEAEQVTPAASARQEPDAAKAKAETDTSKPKPPRTTLVPSTRAEGGDPVVTVFGVQLTEDAPAPDAWHWNEGDVMLGGGPRMPMVKIAAGRFTLGSGPHEVGRDTDEDAHEVTLSEYWIGATEVTQAQWKAVMGTEPSSCVHGCGDTYPVNEVSWEDMARFANVLSASLELQQCYREDSGSWVWDSDCDGFRLPTEAEWEHAARAGTTTPYHFGIRSDLCDNANIQRGFEDPCDDGREEVQPVTLEPVGTYRANPWGLFDMHGNVRESVWDWSGPYPSGPSVDPRGPASGYARGLRGGSFETDGRFARTAFRDSIGPTTSSDSNGFRCARSIPPR